VGFLGYERDRDPNKGPLGTTRIYRFIAGFGTICFFSFVCGWRPWSGSGRDWWTVATALIVGVGAVREGMGFINHFLFWRNPGEINGWFAVLLLIAAAGLLYTSISAF